MRFETGQIQGLGQHMKLAPHMIQSMEILQLSSMALAERIEQELSSNPALELKEPGDEDEVEAAEIRAEEVRDAQEGERELKVGDDKTDPSHADDFERLDNMVRDYGESWPDESEPYRPARDNGERDAKMDAMANTAARGDSLTEQLTGQWRLVEMSPQLRAAGEYLIGFIDADGYLRVDEETLLMQAPEHVDVKMFGEALAMIQQNLEPVGIGARDLRECLLLQIDARLRHDDDPDDPVDPRQLDLERKLVNEYLPDIMANRLPRIAKEIECDIEDVKRAILALRRYHPHPGRMLVEDSPRTIIPDAIVEFDEEQDRYVARLRNDRLPPLCISTAARELARKKGVDRDTKTFVRTNIANAQWLIEAIQQRDSTVLRVINVVIDAQREFFDFGPQHLRPLPMTTVADQLGVHVATVSRAVSEKYIQTPRGIFPLRMFFSGGTETEGGESMSWQAVQAKLEEIIAAEDKHNPLGDDELVEKLKAVGIVIARRTVAKYRKQLNIPAARQRREF